MEVNEFITDKGIPENNIELILDNYKNPNYKNTLKDTL